MLPPTLTPAVLKSFEVFKLHARRSYLGTRQGGHVSLKRGHGIEFSDYRQYELGDNPRHIDWGLYARSDRLYVKRFQEEQNLTALFLLDASASMFTPAGDRKWEQSRDIALSLSYIALMEQDSVAISVPGIFRSPVYYGGRAFHSVAREVMQVTAPAAKELIVAEARRAVSAVRFPGIAVLISDFLMPIEEIESLISILRAKSLDITAIQVIGAHDREPFPVNSDVVATDSETGQRMVLSFTQEQRRNYEELLDAHNETLKEVFADAQIRLCSVSAEMPIRDVIVNNLPKLGLLS